MPPNSSAQALLDRKVTLSVAEVIRLFMLREAVDTVLNDPNDEHEASMGEVAGLLDSTIDRAIQSRADNRLLLQLRGIAKSVWEDRVEQIALNARAQAVEDGMLRVISGLQEPTPRHDIDEDERVRLEWKQLQQHVVNLKKRKASELDGGGSDNSDSDSKKRELG